MNHVVNMLGNPCPAPLDALITADARARVGDTITLDFDCAQATENLPAWCMLQGHTVLSLAKTGPAQWQILVRKER